jgi:4a-hydroxytetrahydrobiopterin dehydratase
MENLTQAKCVPCEGGVAPLTEAEIAEFTPQVPEWRVVEHHHIMREWKFPDFASALKAVNAIGAIAESEGHHPDIRFGWGYLEVTLYTHAIDGLFKNDFILAAKIDAVLGIDGNI